MNTLSGTVTSQSSEVGQAFQPDVSLERLTYICAVPAAGAPSSV